MGSRSAVGVAKAIGGTPLSDKVIGVFCISYPLHTKDNTSALRDAPLYELSKPVCFISGDKDEMCKKELFDKVLLNLRRYHIHWVKYADHSLNERGKKKHEKSLSDEMASVLKEWISDIQMESNGEFRHCHKRKIESTTEEVANDDSKMADKLGFVSIPEAPENARRKKRKR